MDDYLIRIITEKVNVRGLACVTTDLVNEACQLHRAHPTPSAALGRALTGGVLMGALLKTGQRIALKFEGDGPLKKIVVEADSDGVVRGYVAVPELDLPLSRGKLDVSGALGKKGLFTVIKDLRLKEPYSGTVDLFTGEIGEDIAYYFKESEQIPSAVGLGVYLGVGGNVSAAGGFLIQSFPPYDEEAVEKLIQRIREMPGITDFIRDGKTPEELLEMLFEGIPYDVLEKRALAYKCSCSRERTEQALISLGREEIESIITEEEEIDVTCEFCRKSYPFNREDLTGLLGEV